LIVESTRLLARNRRARLFLPDFNLYAAATCAASATPGGGASVSRIALRVKARALYSHQRGLTCPPYLYDDGCEVIFSAALMDYALQLVGGALRLLELGKHPRYLFVRHMAIYTVAAQEKARPVAYTYGLHLDIDFGLDAQRAIYYVAVGVSGGPLFRYDPGAYVVVEVGVVDGLA
jgi:hypothetical protein